MSDSTLPSGRKRSSITKSLEQTGPPYKRLRMSSPKEPTLRSPHFNHKPRYESFFERDLVAARTAYQPLPSLPSNGSLDIFLQARIGSMKAQIGASGKDSRPIASENSSTNARCSGSSDPDGLKCPDCQIPSSTRPRFQTEERTVSPFEEERKRSWNAMKQNRPYMPLHPPECLWVVDD
ncbi:MAG: hypothetical protein M1834_009613 [Cirrosporium novae-zelandiae]|nr:MAG: hypothetical protein M1834_009613 [Cirrosporium novae-zelandiae]